MPGHSQPHKARHVRNTLHQPPGVVLTLARHTHTVGSSSIARYTPRTCRAPTCDIPIVTAQNHDGAAPDMARSPAAQSCPESHPWFPLRREPRDVRQTLRDFRQILPRRPENPRFTRWHSAPSASRALRRRRRLARPQACEPPLQGPRRVAPAHGGIPRTPRCSSRPSRRLRF